MDCTVAIYGLLVIDGSVDGCTAQFWRYTEPGAAVTRPDSDMTAGLAGCTLAFKSRDNRLMTLRMPE